MLSGTSGHKLEKMPANEFSADEEHAMRGQARARRAAAAPFKIKEAHERFMRGVDEIRTLPLPSQATPPLSMTPSLIRLGKLEPVRAQLGRSNGFPLQRDQVYRAFACGATDAKMNGYRARRGPAARLGRMTTAARNYFSSSIEPPHHRQPPQRIASEQPNHSSPKEAKTFATKSAKS
jgi:hypothetical protein